jgi:hypothetical protein
MIVILSTECSQSKTNNYNVEFKEHKYFVNEVEIQLKEKLLRSSQT